MYNNLYNIFTQKYIEASNNAALQRDNEKYKGIINIKNKKYKALKKDYSDLIEKFIELENRHVCLELKYEDFLNNIFTNNDYIFDDTDEINEIVVNCDSNASTEHTESKESSNASTEMSIENLSDDYETI
jgi:hypothetical protein